MRTTLVLLSLLLTLAGCDSANRPAEKTSERVDSLARDVRELEKFCMVIKDERRPNRQEAMEGRIRELEKFCAAIRLEIKNREPEQIKKPPTTMEIVPIQTVPYYYSVPVVVPATKATPNPDDEQESFVYRRAARGDITREEMLFLLKQIDENRKARGDRLP